MNLVEEKLNALPSSNIRDLEILKICASKFTVQDIVNYFPSNQLKTFLNKDELQEPQVNYQIVLK